MEPDFTDGGQTQDGTVWYSGREGGDSCKFFSHGGHIPAANAVAQRGMVAMASNVAAATTAAAAAEARGGVPFAEGPAGFVTANQEIGGGAALHTGEG